MMFSPKNLNIFVTWQVPLFPPSLTGLPFPTSSLKVLKSKSSRDSEKSKVIFGLAEVCLKTPRQLLPAEWAGWPEPLNVLGSPEHLFDTPIFVFLGVPEAEVTWFRNKSKLSSSQHLHEGSLLLTNVSFSDQGLYSCRAANVHGEQTESTQLLILGKKLLKITPSVGPWVVTDHPPPPFSLTELRL